MKKGTPRNPKVADLAERLSIELFAAVGILEMLWHFAAEFAPAGDIGRHSNLTIAKALCWRGKPDKLIVTGLVPAHWIDVCEPHRLVVHGWPEHCDDSVHMKLARAKQFFFDGTAPNIRRLPSSERALLERFYAESVRTQSALETHEKLAQGQGMAKAVLEVQENSFPIRPNSRAVPWQLDEPYAMFRDAYLAIGGPAIESDWEDAYPDWKSMNIGAKLAAIEHVKGCDGAFVLHPRNYIRKGEYNRPARPAPRSKAEIAMGGI